MMAHRIILMRSVLRKNLEELNSPWKWVSADAHCVAPMSHTLPGKTGEVVAGPCSFSSCMLPCLTPL
eukprot:scaffold16424_cov21-Tisochrysis_lutea.AAC.1